MKVKHLEIKFDKGKTMSEQWDIHGLCDNGERVDLSGVIKDMTITVLPEDQFQPKVILTAYFDKCDVNGVEVQNIFEAKVLPWSVTEEEYVRFNDPHGSYGIVEARRNGRVYIRYYYGKDSLGEDVTGLSSCLEEHFADRYTPVPYHKFRHLRSLPFNWKSRVKELPVLGSEQVGENKVVKTMHLPERYEIPGVCRDVTFEQIVSIIERPPL